MTEREADEAELELLKFVAIMQRYRVSPIQAMIFAATKIAAMYAGAYDPNATVH